MARTRCRFDATFKAKVALEAIRGLKKLLDNARIVRYLALSYPEILHEFQKIAESRSLSENPDVA